jgi:hypothetical protein
MQLLPPQARLKGATDTVLPVKVVFAGFAQSKWNL